MTGNAHSKKGSVDLIVFFLFDPKSSTKIWVHWYRSYITLVRTRKPWYCFLYSRISCWSCNHTFILLLGGVVAQEHRQLVLLAPFGVLQSSPPIIKTIAVGKSDSAHRAGVNTTHVWCSHICGVWLAQGLAYPRHHTCVIFHTSVVSWRRKKHYRQNIIIIINFTGCMSYMIM